MELLLLKHVLLCTIVCSFNIQLSPCTRVHVQTYTRSHTRVQVDLGYDQGNKWCPLFTKGCRSQQECVPRRRRHAVPG